MSFNSDGQSQYSGVPPSAQPYRSLFGGSSQNTLSQDQKQRSPDNEASGQLDGATIAGDPSVEYEESDDNLDYIQTSDREPSISPNKVDSSAPPQSSPVKPILKRRDSPRSSISPPPYRPNRFHGPAHTWLSLTREDREITEALRETGARDLAAHLYNAHVLQSQGLARLEQLNADRPDENEPDNKVFDDNDLVNNIEDWTAWPMPSDEVPRADERLRRLEDDRWTFRMKPDSRPSAELEESIMAFMLKTAKERFQSRAWDNPVLPSRQGIPGPAVDGAGADAEDMKVDPRSADEEMDDTEWESEEGIPLRPIIQTDDDEARRKLRPLARNVITQFDQLLMGLHRFHGAAKSDDGNSSRSRSRGRKRSSPVASGRSSVYSIKAEGEDKHPRTGRAQGTPERSASRGRKRIRRISQPSRPNSAHAENADASRHGARASSANRYGQSSGLTGWREVAGVASMVGLPPAVLQRATQRFSALMGEGPESLSFPEGPNQNFMEGMLEWTSRKDDLQGEEPQPRSGPASRATSTGKRSASPAKAPLSRTNSVKNEEPLVCPFKKCSRHTKGFSRRWNLNQHLKTMHPSYQPKDNKPQASGVVKSGYDSDMSE